MRDRPSHDAGEPRPSCYPHRPHYSMAPPSRPRAGTRAARSAANPESQKWSPSIARIAGRPAPSKPISADRGKYRLALGGEIASRNESLKSRIVRARPAEVMPQPLAVVHDADRGCRARAPVRAIPATAHGPPRGRAACRTTYRRHTSIWSAPITNDPGWPPRHAAPLPPAKRERNGGALTCGPCRLFQHGFVDLGGFDIEVDPGRLQQAARGPHCPRRVSAAQSPSPCRRDQSL